MNATMCVNVQNGKMASTFLHLLLASKPVRYYSFPVVGAIFF